MPQVRVAASERASAQLPRATALLLLRAKPPTVRAEECERERAPQPLADELPLLIATPPCEIARLLPLAKPPLTPRPVIVDRAYPPLVATAVEFSRVLPRP